jgi:hypothetical protein
MSTTARPPRKAKRQKREHDAAIGKDKQKPSASFEAWRTKAKEALNFRDESINEVVSPLTEMQLISQSHPKVPISWLNKEEISTAWTPEHIVRSIANGDIRSHTVADMYLRSAVVATRSVSFWKHSSVKKINRI